MSGIAGNPADVDLVDLLRIEKLFRVAEVHAVPDEDVEEVRIDVSVQLEAPEDLQ